MKKTVFDIARLMLLLSVLVPVLSLAKASAGNNIDFLKHYNVTWTTPSADAWDSMPLSGKYGTGANVWVQDGSLWLYLAHNYAYDEYGHLLKLGALRLSPSNGALSGLSSFRQQLDISTGSILIDALSNKGTDFHAKLWFSGENLIIETDSKTSNDIEVSFGTWRDITRDTMYLDLNKRIATSRADHIKMNRKSITWYHDNSEYPSQLTEELAKQDISPSSICDPTKNNVFGGAIISDNGLIPSSEGKAIEWQTWKGAAWTAKTLPSKSHKIIVALRADNGSDHTKWAGEAASFLDKSTLARTWKANLQRWKEFWNRSHIYVNPTKDASDSAWVASRNYQLFRYMSACNQEGRLPLLFNGGIFTTDNFNRINGNSNGELTRKQLSPSSPDTRHWMFCGFMAQNERWLGWPTILSGDVDLLEASNAFYRMHAATATSRAKILGAEGMAFTESQYVWGLTWWAIKTGQCGAPHLKNDFSMMLENAWMALSGYATLGKDISKDMNWIKGVVKFYDSYYRMQTKEFCSSELLPNKKLNIFPANSIELLVGATNPIEAVAGLRRITDALTKLPDNLVSEQEKEYFANVLKTIPELPVGDKDGKPILLPAKSYMNVYNRWELPEFYLAWPYRLKGVCNPGTSQILQDTWDLLPERRKKLVSRDYSWMPVVVNMAAMGNTKEAARRVVAKLGNFTPQSRFPAFFGPGHDWVPDHNWGGSGMVGMQEMLMSANPYGDGKIYLLPAWPTCWDVDFKLHAPQQTTIEVSVKNGEVVKLNVTPASRKADIVLNPQFRLNK